MLFKSKISNFDLCLFGMMWLIVFFASIKSLGVTPALVFFSLNLILVLRNTINGLLVLILITFTPVTALVGMPIGAYAQAAILLFGKYILVDFLINRKVMTASIAFNLMLIFVVYLTASLLFFSLEDRALRYYQNYLEALLVVFLFASVVLDANKLVLTLKFWAMVAALSVFIKLAHVYFGDQTALFNILKNVDVGSDYDLGHRLSIYIDGEYASRLIWAGEEPNYSSVSMIFPFAISFALFLLGTGSKRILWGAITLLISIATIGTYSRSGFITIIIVAIMFLLKGRIKNSIPFATLGAAAVLVITLSPTLISRIFTIDDAAIGTGSGRFYLWGRAFDLWLDSPVIGGGFSSYYKAVGSAAHNTYLEILADTGVIGLVLFLLIILASVYRKIVFRLHHRNNELAQFFSYLSSGVLGVAIILNTVTYHDVKLFWIVCIAGYMSNYYLKKYCTDG
ncbi:MAG: O-antigen ligase family protein [Sedimenticola sp.]